MNDFFISCQESRIENPRSFYGCFYLGPFNSSQSLTVANALRRTLLSELSGIAITSVEIQGAVHEYSTLTGIRDSVLDILLNLKQIVLKTGFTDSTKTDKNKRNKIIRPLVGYLQARGPGIVRAADLKLPASIQCVDPDQYIANLSADGFLNMKIIINRGKNHIIQNSKYSKFSKKESAEYQFSNRIQNDKLNRFYAESTKHDEKNTKTISTMPLSIDAVFMPITKVNYVIENHSIKDANAINYIQNMSQKDSILQISSPEFLDSADCSVDQQKAYYEKTVDSHVVILEIWTNGSIHPRRAVYDALKNLMYLFSQLEKMKILNSLFTTELYKTPNKADDTSDEIFKKIEYEYEYYIDMKDGLKKSKTQTQLSPEAFLRAQKEFEKQYKQEMFNEKELKKIQISSLSISNRACKLLEESQIYTLADLIKNPNTKLTSIKGFGKKCLQEVKQALEKIGLDFISEKCS